MPSLSNQQRAGIALGIPVVALLLYLWYRRRRNSQYLEEQENLCYDTAEESETVASANQRTIEVKVPRSVVGAIIGKSGANIKKIERDSGARLNLKDEDDGAENMNEERIVLIQGEREMAKRAEILVKKIIAEQPVIRTEEVYVPQRACGRIIGKGGQTIRHMSHVSGARIRIDRDGDDLNSSLRKCLITGTSDQIASAKGLLDEKVGEDNEIRNRKGEVRTYRSRHIPRKLNAIQGIIQFPKIDDFCEVFVSAIDTPGHFWVQIITEDSPQLDKLTNDLTSLYSSSESTAVLNAFKVGDVCCAPFEFDSLWYRACILDMNKDGTVELYYLDFGDSGQISKDKLRELKSEHNRLPFQAIECFLAGVKATGDGWSKEATDEFEKLSHCAQWISLMARVVNYSGEIPCLELIDTAGKADVNINEEMIERQFAVHNTSHSTEEPEDVINASSMDPDNELQETAEVIKPSMLEQREFAHPGATQNGDTTEETPIVGLDNVLAPSSSDTLSEAPSKDAEDGPPFLDTTDSSTALSGPVVPETESPVKAAVVKTISKDYVPLPAMSMSTLLTGPDEGELADVRVVKEKETFELEPAVGNLNFMNSTKVEGGKESLVDLKHFANTTRPDSEEKPSGYRSSLNIMPSSKRTMAASFAGSRRNMDSPKQSFVSSVTLPEHSHNGNVVVSVTPIVTQVSKQSPSELQVFVASNVSTKLTNQTVTSEVDRTVTQENRSDTTSFTASRLEEKLKLQSSSPEGNKRVTYEISFQGAPGTEPYTVRKTHASSLQNAPLCTSVERSMSPSSSFLEVSSNTVIDEEEEYEQAAEGKRIVSGTVTCSDSPEPDSDTESFMSAKEDVTSDTDTAAYLTAGGSSTSLYTDAMSPVDSATEEATTPVNSDTEVDEEEDEGDETGEQESVTPRSHAKEASKGRDSGIMGLREQTALLGSGVTSDADLGYRGDTEEGLASTEDLRATGT